MKFSSYTQERRIQTRTGRESGYDFIARNGEITRGGEKKHSHLQNENGLTMVVEGDEH